MENETFPPIDRSEKTWWSTNNDKPQTPITEAILRDAFEKSKDNEARTTDILYY